MRRRELIRASILASAIAMTLMACGGPKPTAPTPVSQPSPDPPADPVVPPEPPRPAPTLGIARILAFGDSMTEGVDSPPPLFALDWTLPQDAGRPQSYPHKLKTMIDARYTGQTIAVFNGGWAGRQAREDRGRFADAMSQAKPDLILLMEGANDLNQELRPGEGLNARVSEVVNALEDFVRDAGFRNIPVLIATLPPQRPGGPKAWSAELLPRLNAAIADMAGKKGAGVVDIAQLPLALIGQDGLHPTEAGYERIAATWLDAVRARYEKVVD